MKYWHIHIYHAYIFIIYKYIKTHRRIINEDRQNYESKDIICYDISHQLLVNVMATAVLYVRTANL